MARKHIYLEANKGLASYEQTCLCSFCCFLYISIYSFLFQFMYILYKEYCPHSNCGAFKIYCWCFSQKHMNLVKSN